MISLQARKIILLILVSIFSVVVGWIFWPQISLLGDKDFVDNLIRSAGPWGALVFVGLQMAQVIIAPIPSSVVGLVGGYIFGTFLGTVYSMIGSTIGFLVVFWLAKKFGRKFLSFFVSKNTFDKYDKILARRAKPFLFISFLLPIIPEAALGYIAGMTPLSIRTLMILTFIARLPGVLVVNFIGQQTAEANYLIVAIIAFVLAIVVGLMYKFKDPIDAFLDKVFPDDNLEEMVAEDEREMEKLEGNSEED